MYPGMLVPALACLFQFDVVLKNHQSAVVCVFSERSRFVMCLAV